MDEKLPLSTEPLLDETSPHNVYIVEEMSSGPSLRRRVLRIFLLTAGLWILVRSIFAAHHRLCQYRDSSGTGLEHAHVPLMGGDASHHVLKDDFKNGSLVPLEIHIMSKCPDAAYCLQKLVVPAMEKVHEIVDFKMSFIGRLDPDSDAVACMHGPGECLGNIILLCAAKLYPDPKIHLGYANCLLRDYKDIPSRDLVEECALEHGVDFGKLNRCISDEGEGQGLLHDSVQRSEEGGVKKSCTVRVNGDVYCVRDGGKWVDCKGGSTVKGLVKDIEKLYAGSGT